MWVEDTGDDAGALVYCNMCSVQDGAPSKVHDTPVTVLALARAEALGWAAEHAAHHRTQDAIEAAVRTMPPHAHRPARRGRPRKAA